ncbi:MAG: hypothetical protein WDW36_006918 [Sanguina aurantia]
MQRVVVTGLGLVTPLAVGVAGTWDRLTRGDSGIQTIPAEHLPEDQRAVMPQLTASVAGLVPKEDLQKALDVLNEDPRRNPPFIMFALAAAAEALGDAGWLHTSPTQREMTGVAIGSGMSCTTEVAEAGRLVCDGKVRRVSPFFVPRILPNMAAGAVSIRYGFQGPNHAVSTACATGAHAIGDAFRMIQRGDANVMVAGGTESCVDAISLAGFGRLKALSTSGKSDPTSASRPFDEARDGFVMGEGAGVLVLESMSHAHARGGACIRGYGMSGDGHHITHPHPQGLGASLAMRRALAGSGVAAGDVAYINAHATSTPTGDSIELIAIQDVFYGQQPAHTPTDPPATDTPPPSSTAHAHGCTTVPTSTSESAGGAAMTPDAGPSPAGRHNSSERSSDSERSGDSSNSSSSSSGAKEGDGGSRDGAEGWVGAVCGPLLVSSTKGATGHLLGAAGAVEAVFAVLALHHKVAPPTVNLTDPGAHGFPGLVGTSAGVLRQGPCAALSNSFGFGGTNACLLFVTPPGTK